MPQVECDRLGFWWELELGLGGQGEQIEQTSHMLTGSFPSEVHLTEAAACVCTKAQVWGLCSQHSLPK